jgi:hypothetical protein
MVSKSKNWIPVIPSAVPYPCIFSPTALIGSSGPQALCRNRPFFCPWNNETIMLGDGTNKI